MGRTERAPELALWDSCWWQGPDGTYQVVTGGKPAGSGLTARLASLVTGVGTLPRSLLESNPKL